MDVWNRCIAAVLVLTVAGFFVPNTVFCSGSRDYAKADSGQITRHEIKIKSSPEADIPVAKSAVSKKSGAGKWLLIGLGAVAVIALVAGGGGGGGSGGGGGGTTSTRDGDDIGTVVINAPAP